MVPFVRIYPADIDAGLGVVLEDDNGGDGGDGDDDDDDDDDNGDLVDLEMSPLDRGIFSGLANAKLSFASGLARFLVWGLVVLFFNACS